MTTLYELTDDYMKLLESSFDPETGEVDDSPLFEQLLAQLGGAIDQKIEGCAKVIKTMEADISSLKAEEQRLAGRRRSIEANRKRLRDYMAESMAVTGKNQIKTARFTVSLRPGKKKLTLDPALIPKDYRIEPEPKDWPLDKDKIRSDLDKEVAVPGAELIDGAPFVTIR